MAPDKEKNISSLLLDLQSKWNVQEDPISVSTQQPPKFNNNPSLIPLDQRQYQQSNDREQHMPPPFATRRAIRCTKHQVTHCHCTNHNRSSKDQKATSRKARKAPRRHLNTSPTTSAAASSSCYNDICFNPLVNACKTLSLNEPRIEPSKKAKISSSPVSDKKADLSTKEQRRRTSEEEHDTQSTAQYNDTSTTTTSTVNNQNNCDVTIGELASYFETFVHIPKKMSTMAEMMYI